ncbi:MAG: helix-turn-helix transcriptional regulator [Planctomycetota bacterium]
MNEFRSKLGGRLRQLREEAGKTQAELAKIIGRTSLTVRRWEQGLQVVNAEDLTRLCDEFDVTSDWLLRGSHHVLDTARFEMLTEAKQVNDEFYELHAVLSARLHRRTRRVTPDELAKHIDEVETRRLGLVERSKRGRRDEARETE